MDITHANILETFAEATDTPTKKKQASNWVLLAWGPNISQEHWVTKARPRAHTSPFAHWAATIIGQLTFSQDSKWGVSWT